MTANPPQGGVAALTLAALLGFAANSILCRLALREAQASAAGFTLLRLAAGAVTLLLLAGPGRGARHGNFLSAALLFGYAASFSFAYLRVEAGAGALLLFGAVQITMLGGALGGGERPRAGEVLGLALASAGLLVLTRPSLTRVDPAGALLMLVAGACWGAYSLRGRGESEALAATAGNFLRAVPFALLLAAIDPSQALLEARGAALALLSGSLTSGIAYSLWYAALPRLGAARAGIVQLAVPPLAAVAGVVLLGERPGARLLGAGALVLCGVALATQGPRRPR